MENFSYVIDDVVLVRSSNFAYKEQVKKNPLVLDCDSFDEILHLLPNRTFSAFQN